MTKKNNKGADSGTQYSGWTKNPHEFESSQNAEEINKEQVKRVVKSKKIKLTNGTVNVYKAEFSEIDKCLDEIRKECRTHGLNNYSCNNIKIILEETLKRIKLSEN